MGNKIRCIVTIVFVMTFIILHEQQAFAISKILLENPTDTIGTKTHTVKGVFSVYPDLATGNLNVKWENQSKGIAKVIIMDTADVEVLYATINISAPSGNSQVDLSKLKLGDYTIIVNSEKISFTGRLSVVP